MRIGGIDDNIKIESFNYLKLNFNSEFIKAFKNMQSKYVLSEEYKISIDEVKNVLVKIQKQLRRYSENA